MARVKADEEPVNVDLPKDLVKRVVKYQHRRELRAKKDAVRELLEKGLEVADQEQGEAPKS